MTACKPRDKHVTLAPKSDEPTFKKASEVTFKQPLTTKAGAASVGARASIGLGVTAALQSDSLNSTQSRGFYTHFQVL